MLTHTQRKIAGMLCEGKTREQIADALCVKPATVKKQIQRARHRASKKQTVPRMRRTRVRPFSLLSTDNI